MKAIKDIVFIKGERTEPFEYWCQDCKQLRLSFVITDKCGNCGSCKIVKGDIGKLKKE